jgi:hypothetical protein
MLQRDTRRFLVALLLAWAPFVAVMVPLVMLAATQTVYRSSSASLVAVANPRAAFLTTIAAFVTLGIEILAIVLLVRQISSKYPMRSALAVMSLCCSMLMIVLASFYLWRVFIRIA